MVTALAAAACGVVAGLALWFQGKNSQSGMGWAAIPGPAEPGLVCPEQTSAPHSDCTSSSKSRYVSKNSQPHRCVARHENGIT
jgi:hypothetical protein